MSEIAEPITLKSKPHFEILDGLRGVAALAVVVFHFIEMFVGIDRQPYCTWLSGGRFLFLPFWFCGSLRL